MYKVVKVSFLFILITLSGCFEKDVFSDVPKIELTNVAFINSNSFFDTLTISFKFENGGGDFWISADDDIFPPYNEFNFFIDENNDVITAENYDEVALPIYRVPVLLRNFVATRVVGNDVFFTEDGDSYVIFGFNRDTLQSVDELPPLECPNITNQDGSFDTQNFKIFDYINGELVSEDKSVTKDVVVERVDTHFNLLISFEEKINGEFIPIDFQEKFQTENCDGGLFNARVPFFEEDSESGSIDYKLLSNRLSPAFIENEIRITISIIDRAFNRSNESSLDFFLPEITQ